MKRSMLAFAVLCAAASFPLVGCSDDAVTDTGHDDGHADDIGADADADGDDDGAEDAAPEDVTEAEAEFGICGAPTCVNDPADGPIGVPCIDDTFCDAALQCSTESSAVFRGREYFSDIGGYCMTYGAGTAGCDPDVTSSCPTGSKCIYFGTDSSTGLVYYGCMDSCTAASRMSVPWTNNCDCRDGYACEIMDEVCMSGCSNDKQCCEIWHDGVGGAKDYVRQDAEVVDLPASECTDTCNRCTYACTQMGCPGAACHMGDACEHDSDCPAQSRCISEFQTRGAFVGGMCIKDRCDLSGRGCPVGSGCVNLGSGTDPWDICAVPCTATTVPGEAGYPCRDIDPPGPSVGDYACMPLRVTMWIDGVTTDDGWCWAGNFTTGTGAYGHACLTETECISPYGLGDCINITDTPKFCTAWCNQAVAEAGACGAADPVTHDVAGACVWGLCLEVCDPAVTPAECSLASNACYPTGPFGGGYVVTGGNPVTGICLPRCANDAWCVKTYGVGTCNTTTGVCA